MYLLQYAFNVKPSITSEHLKPLGTLTRSVWEPEDVCKRSQDYQLNTLIYILPIKKEENCGQRNRDPFM